MRLWNGGKTRGRSEADPRRSLRRFGSVERETRALGEAATMRRLRSMVGVEQLAVIG